MKREQPIALVRSLSASIEHRVAGSTGVVVVGDRPKPLVPNEAAYLLLLCDYVLSCLAPSCFPSPAVRMTRIRESKRDCMKLRLPGATPSTMEHAIRLGGGHVDDF